MTLLNTKRSRSKPDTVNANDATFYAKRTMGGRCRGIDPVPVAFTRSVQPQAPGPTRWCVTGA
jgi:hypothetical protein